MKNRRVLLLSGYDAASHKLWRERLQASLSNWQWTSLALPPRHFAWRLRSNGMQWAYEEIENLRKPYDLLIATSMVDLSTLRGLVPELSNIPTVVYFHENQFAYPAGRQRTQNMEPILVPIYSALCADLILFNSQFNRSTFLQGLETLSNKLPEPFPANALKKLEESLIAPVPLPAWPPRKSSIQESSFLSVVWNHRWEYDKGPQLLLEVIQKSWGEKLPIQFHVVGQQFREQPEEFVKIEALLQSTAQHFGWSPSNFGFLADQEAYLNLLYKTDVVLSTALHDFQGLAVQEACLAGCSPIAPNDLVYPEYLPGENLYSMEASIEKTAANVIAELRLLLQKKQSAEKLPIPNLKLFKPENLKSLYERLLSPLIKE